jgi:hypothetical protein
MRNLPASPIVALGETLARLCRDFDARVRKTDWLADSILHQLLVGHFSAKR